MGQAARFERMVTLPKDIKVQPYVNISGSRLKQLTPIVWKEIERQFSDAEYFTRDHLLYFACMRQFSMSYRITLIRLIINHLTATDKLIRYNISDFGVNNSSNYQRLLDIRKSNEVTYSGSYTTRAADELLSRHISNTKFNQKWLSRWLLCLDHLAPSTKTNYSKRIIDDLLRRGVLILHAGPTYSVNRQ